MDQFIKASFKNNRGIKLGGNAFISTAGRGNLIMNFSDLDNLNIIQS